MVDPSRVPQRKLYTGATIPAIGLGTFGSDQASHQQVAEAVRGAAEVGYRHFDCAAVYCNEALIGNALQDVLKSGVKRDDLWITSKLWNNNHAEEDVIPAFKKSLADLGLEYLDIYLIHWPFPNHHATGVDVSSRDNHAKPYIHQNYMKTWRQLEKLVDLGLVRHIGTSNMTMPKLELLLTDARIKPAVNEMEMHPHFQQPELFKFVKDNDMEVIAYCPIGSPNRPERDRTAQDTNPLEDSVIVKISQRLGVHPATVCLKWAIQHGQIPIPMSVNRKNYLANLQAAVTEPLTVNDMNDIASIDKNCRLIKGQVFLWKENQDWQDLWDVNGVIPQ
jgi:alcohol dehydrogenase (NADP+)